MRVPSGTPSSDITRSISEPLHRSASRCARTCVSCEATVRALGLLRHFPPPAPSQTSLGFLLRSLAGALARPSLLLFPPHPELLLLAKVGYQWMPRGTQVEVLTPGTNEKRYLAGALDITTGTMTHCVWYRKTTGLFLDLLDTLDRTHPAPLFLHLTVVADNAKIHHARAVEKWLATHPRFELLYLPTYCPRANPIERAFGDVHDKCTRNHTRKRMWHLVQDVKQHLRVNGPWRYALSDLYYTPEVTAAVEALQAADISPDAISQLAA